jgi:hypothetical protein
MPPAPKKAETPNSVPDQGDPDRKRVLNVLAQRRYSKFPSCERLAWKGLKSERRAATKREDEGVGESGRYYHLVG